MVLAPGEAILFFGRWSLKEGLPHKRARDVAFSMAGPVIWAGRHAQMKMTVNTVQEGHQAIADTMVGKEDESPRTRTSLREEDLPDPCCGMQHWRMDVRHRRGWFWGGVEEWKSWGIVELSQETHSLGMLVGGEDIIEDKTDPNFLEMLLVDLPLLEGEVPTKEVIKVFIIQPWLEDPGKATDLHGQEGI